MIFLRHLLAELGFEQKEPSIIFEDNEGAIDISQSRKQYASIKHIDIRDHFIRDRVLEHKDIILNRLPTQDMTADLFTKQLPFTSFSKHRHDLGVKLK